MYHYRTFIALILIGLIVPVLPRAQTHLFHPVEQPLSNSYVRCIYKDSKGYLWAGTFNGLNRYDGAGIKTYHHEAGKPTRSVTIWSMPCWRTISKPCG